MVTYQIRDRRSGHILKPALLFMPVQWSPRLELCPRFVKVGVHELLQLSRRAGRRQVVERGQNHICSKTREITQAGSRNASATYLEAAAASCPRSVCHHQRVWPSGLDARWARSSRSHWKHQGDVYMRVARMTVHNKSSIKRHVCGTRIVLHRFKLVFPDFNL